MVKRFALTVAMLVAVGLVAASPVDSGTEAPARVTPLPTYDQISDHGFVSPWEQFCWQAIAPMRPLADLANTPLVCGEPSLIMDGAVGVFNGVAIVGYSEGWEDAYYRDIAAHELGHAWDWNVIRPAGLQQPIMDRLGWATWELEHWAEIWAYCVGQWELGTTWRVPGSTYPTAEDCNAYRAMGAVPVWNPGV